MMERLTMPTRRFDLVPPTFISGLDKVLEDDRAIILSSELFVQNRQLIVAAGLGLKI